MPDSPPSPEPKPPSFIQIPIDLVEYVRSLKLTGTQYDLWLYLYELDPYGDRWINISSPEKIADLLKVSYRTVQRAAQRLDDCGLFEIKVEAWKARNTTVSIKKRDFSTDKEIRMRTKRSRCPELDKFVGSRTKLSANGQKDPNVESEPAQGNAFSALQTIQTIQTLSESERETKGNESGEPLVLPWFELTEDGLLTISQAYEDWLRKKAASLPTYPTLIEQWIESESMKEANQRQFLQERSTGNGVVIPPAPPDQFQIESSIDSALLNGDRSFAWGKLQRLWAEGWHEQVEELLELRRDWGFRLSNEGVSDEST